MTPLSGMTGFARCEGAFGAWTWAVEARSVNGRNLEARYKGPPGFDALERVVRDGAQKRFQRGQISVGLQARRNEGAVSVQVNIEALDQLVALSRDYVARGDVAAPRFDGLLLVRGVMDASDGAEDEAARKALEAAMAACVEQALDGLKIARDEEGVALCGVLGGIVDRIETLRTLAETQAAAQGPALKDRYAKRIADLVGEAGGGLEERIVQEAALLAVKADVREELDRLLAHIDGARTLLADGGPAGRRLDFLAQEFMREANTLCSKSASSALTATGLDLKAAIEQFREQIQNVE
ncbi:MAG: YicC family protein [Caulobacterales bacterium 32-69-10]|nr:MAG: YicC family protein [Caulobacterales bacterium 32-69-10]